MKIIAIIVRTEDKIIYSAFDLKSFSFFQRSTVKEFIIFFSKILTNKTEYGKRQSVEHEDYMCHIYMKANNIAIILFCDKEYPKSAAYNVLNIIYDKNNLECDSTKINKDTLKQNLESFIIDFQNPANADKLIKVNKDLQKTIDIVHKTIESVLDRGEKMETLIKKSEDLSASSKLFYQEASKANRCCVIQ